jgi:glycolate oxidase FAD binding subunit
MTVLRSELTKLAKGLMAPPAPGAPATDLTVAPSTAGEAAQVLRFASEHGMRVLFWGGGTHQGYGHPVDPDLVMSTQSINSVVDWQSADLTIVVEAGLLVSDLEARLEQRGQTAVLPEDVPGATVGGVIASGLSGWRRLRYGPTRDRVIEAVIATGDGRVVRGGGRLVKNGTGYDLPRLATGSFGSFGLVTSVCLKLWPLTAERAMLEVDNPETALALAYRPDAVIETNDRTVVFLAGTGEEIAAQEARIGGRIVSGHRWPERMAGLYELVLRVPVGLVATAVIRVRQSGWPFQAAHGIGEVRIALEEVADAELSELREWAEAAGGALVVAAAPDDNGFDPWGTPPDALGLQRRVKAAFDPRGIANPGILPGGI